MSPNNPHVATELRQLVYYHIDNGLWRNALFFAGRLHAYEPRSSEATYLLSLCHLNNNQPKLAFEYCRTLATRGSHLGCAYVLAQAGLQLGRNQDGILALERCRGLWAARNSWSKHSEARRIHQPDAAAVLCLLGKLHQANRNQPEAHKCFAEALKLNPFMWDAFLELCDTGANINVPNIFKSSPELIALLSSGDEDPFKKPSDQETSNQSNSFSQAFANGDPFAPDTKATTNGNHYGGNALWEKFNGSTVSVNSMNGVNGYHDAKETPIASHESDEPIGGRLDQVAVAETAPWDPPHAPLRKRPGFDFSQADVNTSRPSVSKSRTKSKVESAEIEPSNTIRDTLIPNSGVDRKRTVSGQPPAASSQPVEGGAPQRRSVRLLKGLKQPHTQFPTASSTNLKEAKDVKKAKATGTKGRMTTSTIGRALTTSRTTGEAEQRDRTDNARSKQLVLARAAAVDKAKEVEGLRWLLDILSKIGSGYFAMSRYNCNDANKAYNSLPSGQRDTPWILAQLGRAAFEQQDYIESEKHFVRLKSLAPSTMEDMEVYSTVLWHMKNDVELAYLAHELIEMDRCSPEAWCALGNSFSLSREHDQALKCFRRATQLNPKFAYAFTLQGHEYIANEEYDKAMQSYRSGMMADNRHYNAWYGLGKVYEKMGKFEIAEQHYRTAAYINPTNAVLFVCIGMVLERQKNAKSAFLQYTRACALAPKSTLAKFKKARALITIGHIQPALEELMALKDMVPDEANVHFLLGRVYKLKRDKAEAIKHFTMALNLDPKVGFLLQSMWLIEILIYIIRLHITSRTLWSPWRMMKRTITIK